MSWDEFELKALNSVKGEELTLELLKEHYRRSLFATCKYLLGYDQMTQYTHGPICELLQSPSKRKLICLPRGTFKSSIGIVGYSIWLLINNPNLRILIDSEVYTNSKNFLREIKQHLVNPKLVRLFGEFKGDVWNEGEIVIKQRNVPKKEASITCGGIGTVKVGQHFDFQLGDDYNSAGNSNTPEARKKIIDHYRLNISILEPDGTYVIIGTRYSEADLIGHIIKNEINNELR